MAKFDFSKLSEKFDLKGIMDSVKSIINPEDIIPKNLEGDPIAAKLALIRATNEGLTKLLEQQQEEIAKVNTLIGSLIKDLEAAKQPSSEPVMKTHEEASKNAEKIDKEEDK